MYVIKVTGLSEMWTSDVNTCILYVLMPSALEASVPATVEICKPCVLKNGLFKINQL